MVVVVVAGVVEDIHEDAAENADAAEDEVQVGADGYTTDAHEDEDAIGDAIVGGTVDGTACVHANQHDTPSRTLQHPSSQDQKDQKEEVEEADYSIPLSKVGLYLSYSDS